MKSIIEIERQNNPQGFDEVPVGRTYISENGCFVEARDTAVITNVITADGRDLGSKEINLIAREVTSVPIKLPATRFPYASIELMSTPAVRLLEMILRSSTSVAAPKEIFGPPTSSPFEPGGPPPSVPIRL